MSEQKKIPAYFRLPYSLITHPILRSCNDREFRFFYYILENITFDYYICEETGVKLNPGEMTFNFRDQEIKTGIPRETLSRFLKKFKSGQLLGQRKDNGIIIISVTHAETSYLIYKKDITEKSVKLGQDLGQKWDKNGTSFLEPIMYKETKETKEDSFKKETNKEKRIPFEEISIQSISLKQQEFLAKKQHNIDKETLSSSLDNLVDSSNSLLLCKEEEKKQISILSDFCKLHSLQIKDNTLRLWVFNKKPEPFGFEKVKANLEILVPSKESVRTKHEAWMEAALKKDYAGNKEIQELNREWMLQKKIDLKLDQITITSRYCRDENLGKEYYYQLPEFRQIIERNYLKELFYG